MENFHVVTLKNACEGEDVADVIVDDQHLGAGELGKRAGERGRRALGLAPPLVGLGVLAE